MAIARRHFLFGSASLLALTVTPSEARFPRGSAASGTNSSRVTVNAPAGFLNIAKGWVFTIDPNNMTSDGFPVSKPSSGTYGANPSFPLGYYGQYVWKWTGTGSMAWSAGPPLIVTTSTVNGSNSPVIFELPAGTGDLAPGNHSLVDQALSAGLTNPRIVFSVGWNIQSISDNGSGAVRITTKTGYVTGGPAAGTVVFISGVNTNTGINNQAFAITPIDGQNFDLVGSTFTNSGSVAGTAIYAPLNQSVLFNSTFGPSSFSISNLVVCRSADESAITAGQICDATLVSQIQSLKGTPGGVGRSGDFWLRFMDQSGVQGSYECDFAQRIAPTYNGYSNVQFYRPGYWTPSTSGAITNTSDALTCADPSVSTWNGTSYIDNAIVQGIPSASNIGGSPTLNVGGHGAKPILASNACPITFAFNAPPASAGLSMVWTFDSTAVRAANGGSAYIFTYTTVSGDVTNRVNATGGLNANLVVKLGQDAILAAAGVQFGNRGQIECFPTTAQAGRLTVAYTSGPAICLVVGVNAATFTGSISGNVLTVASGLTGAIFPGSTVTGPGVAAGTLVTDFNSGQGGLGTYFLNIPQTIASTSLTCSVVAPSNATFIYNYLLDAWIYNAGGLVQSVPLEYVSELCNRVGANCWWNWGITKGAWVTAVTNFFATNLTSGAKFGCEIGNELWNSSANPYSQYLALGTSLGIPASSLAAVYSYGALRTVQFNALSKAAWAAASLPSSTQQILAPSQTADTSANGNFDTAQMKGAYLNRSGGTVNGIPNNPIYGTYGGLNGSGSISTNYNISPNRPVDVTNATGCAPYWSSLWLGNGGSISDASAIVGTVTQNAPWLQAALDYANGNTSTAFTSMVNQFTEATSGGSGNGGYDFVSMQTTFTNEEALCAQYDGAGRPSGMPNLIIMDYECGPSWGVGANGVNGINPITASSDISAIASRMTALSWNVSAYGSSVTDVATKAVNLFNGWKLDIDHTGAAANTGSYKSMIKANYYAVRNKQNTGREAHAAQYGYTGPSQWCLFPGDYGGIDYTSFNAISEFNA